MRYNKSETSQSFPSWNRLYSPVAVETEGMVYSVQNRFHHLDSMKWAG